MSESESNNNLDNSQNTSDLSRKRFARLESCDSISPTERDFDSESSSSSEKKKSSKKRSLKKRRSYKKPKYSLHVKEYDCPLKNMGDIKEEECDSDSSNSEEEEENDTIEIENGKKIVEKSPQGRFLRFDELLGIGAQKRVYLALDTDTGKQVAWSSMMVSQLNEEATKRITEEIEILKMVENPHTVSMIYGFFNETSHEIVIINELLSGGSLKSYMKEFDHPKLKVIKKWCKDILEGLYYIHSLSPPIIHRDIKSDNIFIDKYTGTVKIGDFGLSTLLKERDKAKSTLGTLEFCSPEVYMGKYGVKTDIYSFGMTMLELCTKELPYKECNENIMLICDKTVKREMPESLGKIRNQRLKDFILLCLKLEKDRPSAGELLKNEFLNDLESEENNYEPLAYPVLNNKKVEEKKEEDKSEATKETANVKNLIPLISSNDSKESTDDIEPNNKLTSTEEKTENIIKVEEKTEADIKINEPKGTSPKKNIPKQVQYKKANSNSISPINNRHKLVPVVFPKIKDPKIIISKLNSMAAPKTTLNIEEQIEKEINNIKTPPLKKLVIKKQNENPRYQKSKKNPPRKTAQQNKFEQTLIKIRSHKEIEKTPRSSHKYSTSHNLPSNLSISNDN